VSRDPYEKMPRKPVAFTVMPDVVVASDRDMDDEHRGREHENWVSV
jgi:hypothetical protein